MPAIQPDDRYPVRRPLGATHVAASECRQGESTRAAGSLLSQADGPLIESWDGTQWSFDSAPSPLNTNDASLSDVNCITTNTCEAVGHLVPGGYDSSAEQPLAEGLT